MPHKVLKEIEIFLIVLHILYIYIFFKVYESYMLIKDNVTTQSLN